MTFELGDPNPYLDQGPAFSMINVEMLINHYNAQVLAPVIRKSSNCTYYCWRILSPKVICSYKLQLNGLADFWR